MKMGYKVARVLQDGTIISSRTAWYKGSVVKYKIGEFVKPNNNCGPLAVFESLDNIKSFFDKNEMNDDDKIFKCVYCESKYEKLWNPSYELNTLPPGTKLACKVKLIKEVTL